MTTLSAQEKGKIIKVKYSAYPISTHDTPPENSESFKYHPETVELAKGYKYKYSLLIDLNSNQSIYMLDTIIVNKPKGKENVQYMVNDKLAYVIKNDKNNVKKYEEIFQRKFYSVGTVEDIEWVLTNETKTIFGMNCKKAVSENEDMLLTVWYTDEIPVPYGPVNYFGLPGLVVWAEDFFWTTEIEDVGYINDFNFKKELEKINLSFDENKKGKTIEESLLIIKKAELVKSMIEQMKKQ